MPVLINEKTPHTLFFLFVTNSVFLYVSVINTITSPKRGDMCQSINLAKLWNSIRFGEYSLLTDRGKK